MGTSASGALGAEARFVACSPDMGDIRAWLIAARRHVQSARRLAALDDPKEIDIEQVLAVSLDAVLKAIRAHMNLNGLAPAPDTAGERQLMVGYADSNISGVVPLLWGRLETLVHRVESITRNPRGSRLAAGDAHDAVALAAVLVTRIGRAIKLAVDRR
jgi:hypothetical protein